MTLSTLLLGLCSVGSASAQTGSLDIQVTELSGPSGSREGQENLDRGLNALDCTNPADSYIEFTLIPGSTAVTAVDVWAGVGNEKCTTKASRTPPTAVCEYLGYVQIGTSIGSAPPAQPSTIRIGLDAIPQSDTFAFCSSSSPSTVNFLFVANTQNFLDETSAIPPETWASRSVKVDAGPPVSPAIGSATSDGDRQITVDWQRVAETQLILYKVYVELDGCNPAASSGVLVAGEPPPLEVDGVTIFRFGNQLQGEEYSISTSEIGLEVGESASVYVTAMDMAFNESVLSDPICITRVPTAGFCAAWEAEEGEECPSACSTLGGSPSSALWLSALLSLLAVFVHRRRLTR